MKNHTISLMDSLRAAIEAHASAPAFIHGEQVITYRQFERLLRVAIQMLVRRGVARGDVVGLSLDQSPLHCVIMIALAGLGAVSVPVHPKLSASLRAGIVRKYGVRYLISHKADLRLDGPEFVHLPSLTATEGETPAEFPDGMPEADAPFRIALSSGTSGDPKGVLFSHGYLMERIATTLFACEAGSRVIPFDINFALGFVYAIGALTRGGTVVFPKQAGAPGLAAAIHLHAASHIAISPALATRLAALLPEPGVAFPSLRHFRLVGSTPQASLVKALLTRATPHLYVPYGLTEIGPAAMATPEVLAISPDSAGPLLPGVSLEVVDAQDQPLPRGASGEIRLRMAGMPTAYYLDDAQTQRKYRDGWFYPGDRGLLSADGLLFLEGRSDDIIDLDGQMVSPTFVEHVLCQHPAVLEAAVFSRRNANGLQILVAAVVAQAPVQPDELLRYAGGELGPFAPKRVVIVQELPRTPTGKTDRNALAERLAPKLH